MASALRKLIRNAHSHTSRIIHVALLKYTSFATARCASALSPDAYLAKMAKSSRVQKFHSKRKCTTV